MYDLQLLINKIYLYENDFFHYYSFVIVLLLIQLCYFYIYHNGRTIKTKRFYHKNFFYYPYKISMTYIKIQNIYLNFIQCFVFSFCEN